MDGTAPELNGLNGAAYPPARRGWLLVTVLVAAYAVSFVDRQILSLLVDDLHRGLHVDDAHIGLLQGPAFGVFYAVLGMPCGWLADRVSRVRLIATGLLLWTVMTALGGLAPDFWTLFATRMGVGVGEAALVPAAVSLLADTFPRERRVLPLAVFTGGVSLGTGLALALGGGLVAFARGGAGDLPLIGGWLAAQTPWQAVLVMAGSLGIPLAFIMLLFREPPRQGLHPGDAPQVSLFAWLGQNRRLFLAMFGGAAMLYIFSNAFSAWLPSLFIRGFGWGPAQVGAALGLPIAGIAVSGNFLGGGIATLLARRGHANATAMTMALGALVMVPVAILGPLAGDAATARAAAIGVYFAIALCFGVATASFVAVTPAALRGQVVALYLLIGNLFGMGLGPPAVGLLLDRFFQDPARVGTALAIVGGITVTSGAALLLLALRRHAARAAAMPA